MEGLIHCVSRVKTSMWWCKAILYNPLHVNVRLTGSDQFWFLFWPCRFVLMKMISGTCGFYKVLIILSCHTWYLIQMIKVILSGNFCCAFKGIPIHFLFVPTRFYFARFYREGDYDMHCEIGKWFKIQFFRFDSIFSLELLKLLDYQTLWARCQTFKTLTINHLSTRFGPYDLLQFFRK